MIHHGLQPCLVGAQRCLGRFARAIGENPRRRIGGHVQQPDHPSGLVAQWRVQNDHQVCSGYPLRVIKKRVVVERNRLASEDPVDERRDLAPDVGPDRAEPAADRPRVPGAEERRVGVVVEQRALRAPGDAHRMTRGQDQADGVPEALRPGLDGSEGVDAQSKALIKAPHCPPLCKNPSTAVSWRFASESVLLLILPSTVPGRCRLWRSPGKAVRGALDSNSLRNGADCFMRSRSCRRSDYHRRRGPPCRPCDAARHPSFGPAPRPAPAAGPDTTPR